MFDPVALVAADPRELDDHALIELIESSERLAARVAAAQFEAVAELARRRPRDLLDRGVGRDDRGDPRVPEVSEFAVDELAAALRLSRPAAGSRLHVAVELTRLPGTAAELRAGRIDALRARAVVEAVTALDQATALAVEGRVLPRAGQQTVGQRRTSLSRAVLSVDPLAAEQRLERALRCRRVTVTPQLDGTAELWAVLSAEGAAAVYAAVDAVARSAPSNDPRGADERRADALVDLVVAAASDGAGSAGAGCAGAACPGLACAGAAFSGAACPGLACAGAACAGAAFAGAGPGGAASAGAASGRAPVDPVAAPRSGDPPRGCLAVGGGGRSRGLRAHVHVTVPATTLLGLSEEPGELAGHGPITASTARRLARGATWQKVTVDPLTGVVVDVGRPGYTPSAALADLVRTRDGTCRFPGCRQPARRCDLDHVVPYPNGPTAAANIASLCRHHHRLKHGTTWQVDADDGALVWTSPTGHRYATGPPDRDGESGTLQHP